MNWNESDLRRMILDERLTHKQVGVLLGKSAAAVAYHCKAWGIAVPIVAKKVRRSSKLTIDPATVRRLLEEGATIGELAARFECDRNALSSFCKLNGIPVPRRGPRGGERHPKWAGGEVVVGGYRYVWAPDHPHQTRGGYVLQHRLAMEAVLGRHLQPSEVVHHRDGNRLNNDPSNLEVFASNAEHLRHELTGRCPNWSDDGKARIRAGVIRRNAMYRQPQGPDGRLLPGTPIRRIAEPETSDPAPSPD